MTTHALSRSEAARYLGIAEPTLAGWAVGGRGPAFCKVGRRCVYLQADLDAFLAANRRAPAEGGGDAAP